MELWSRIQGEGPVVVIAEAGVNHDGSADDAHELVELVARTGADAVKFQTFRVDALTSTDAASAGYQKSATGHQQQYEMLSNLSLPDSAWAELHEHAHSLGLGFLSTPFDLESAELLAGLGMELVKVPSGEITNLPLLREFAAMFDHMLISTGMASLGEVESAVSAIRDRAAGALMHCVSAYPAPIDQLNLAAIETLREHFRLPVGWSDHSIGLSSAQIAVALGATVVEKHVTLDRSRTGPDHAASADADMMSEFVGGVRRAEQMVGSGVKEPQACELDSREVSRRSWHSRSRLEQGHVLRQEDVVALRPGSGISPAESVVGRRLSVSVESGTLLRYEMLDG